MPEPTLPGFIRAKTRPSGLTAHENEVSFNVTTESAKSEDIIRAVLGSLPALISVADLNGGLNYLDICQKSVEANIEAVRLIRDGIPAVLKGSEQIFVLEYRCAGAEYVSCYYVTVTPLQLSGGGVLISHANITRHIERLRQHSNSEQDYSALIENALNIVEILDSQRRVLYVNQALKRVLGYAPENLIGDFILDRIHPRDRNRIRRMLRQLQEERDLPRAAVRSRPGLGCQVRVDVPIGYP
jgi:PAS domain S-box-containing protein